MKTTNLQYNKIKNLFMSQSYLDAWEDYQRSLRKTNFIKWDYVILTASNESQAEAFRMQIDYRLKKKMLPVETKFVVLPDPDGKRVGSGGATFNVLKYLANEEIQERQSKGEKVDADFNPFLRKRILVIHSGGDSKRVPQYSAEGKLFSPVPRKLPNGKASTLFDEFIIGMSGVAPRFQEGMLVLSGDVLLLFNPLQIDAQFDGAAAISIKEPVFTGKDHGVFLNDGEGNVKNFLHKQTEETLRQIGAVNEQDAVDLDTGAILLNVNLLKALYSLISTDGINDKKKFDEFVNDKARVSFYGDFLFPLAKASTLEQFYLEKPEGEYNDELKDCRTKLWEALSPFSLKLLCLSPARFIHFGTTRELRHLMTEEVQDYEFLDWKNRVVTNFERSIDEAKNNSENAENAASEDLAAIYNSYVGRKAFIDEYTYLENSYVLGETKVGRGSIISNLKLRDVKTPNDVVLHGLPLKNGKSIVRIYGILDNPKGTLADATPYLKTDLKSFVEAAGISEDEMWDKNSSKDLWNAKLFPVCDDMKSATEWALFIYKLACEPQNVSREQVKEYISLERMSLNSSYNAADVATIIEWQSELENRILSRMFIDKLYKGAYYKDALDIFGERGISEDIYETLMNDASLQDFSLKIRIYYALSRYMKAEEVTFNGKSYDYPEELCFKTIQEVVYNQAVSKLLDSSEYHIKEERVDIHLPVRVNWGGGWTDTPPYCLEHGGVVLNAAISLNGILPIQICVKKIDELCVEFESQDIGVHTKIYDTKEIQDCHNPYDSFALHKAALIACGVIPLEDGKESLEDILKRMGGGIYLSTQVVGIPKGSGLGTSSILAGACVKGIFKFFGQEKTDEDIYEVVLCMEQIMSTGGGWQDQVGGLTPGIKLISSMPGIDQHIEVNPVRIPEAALEELQKRFAVIYTGQRRLARNLLRDVIGGYIGAKPSSIKALTQMRKVAAKMTYYLESGDIDSFAELMNNHWELSKMLDKGSSNNCIDQIFIACEDLIDAKFIAGAGGGGFIMVILKNGVSVDELRERLGAIFQDSGVDVWESAFV